MGVLKVKVSGVWTPIGVTGAEVQSGTYTPTLNLITLGSPGQINTAYYTFVGEPFSGGRGHLDVVGQLVLGTGGTIQAGTTQSLSLPPGFQFATEVVGADRIVAHGLHRASPTFLLQGWPLTATTWRPLYVNTVPTIAGINATTPFTWAVGNSMNYHISTQAVRA